MGGGPVDAEAGTGPDKIPWRHGAAVRVLLLFLSMHLLAGNLGELGRGLERFGAVVTFLVFAGITLPAFQRSASGRLAIVLVFLLAGVLVLARATQPTLFIYPAGIFALLALPRRPTVTETELKVLGLATFLYAVFHWLVLYVPAIWYGQHVAGLALSGAAGHLIGRSFSAGETAAGIPILIQMAGFVLAREIVREGGISRIVRRLAILGSVTWLGMMLVAVHTHSALQNNPDPGWLTTNPQIVLFAIMILAVLKDGTWSPGIPGVRPRIALAASVGTALLVFFVHLVMELGGGPLARSSTIALYNRGYLNLARPVYGQYGARSGGMFGLLPDVLKAYGDSVRIVGSLTDDQIVGSDVVIIINLMEFLAPEEKAALYAHVRRGGGLLIMGDHTGVEGIRAPFNDLLQPYGIEFNFDSACFFGDGWDHGAVILPGSPGLCRPTPDEMGVWVGASLTLKPTARPVIIGRYGFSDPGELSSIEDGYLGNRKYEPGEQLGDVVLAAQARSGRGKVMVFGDTSTFQNGSLPVSHAFVQRIVADLTRGHDQRRDYCVALLAVLLSAIAVAVLWSRDIQLTALVSLAMLAAPWIGAWRSWQPAINDALDRVAVIEASHGERFVAGSWKDRGLGGLEFNLMRAGFLPVIGRCLSEEQLAGSRLLVVQAPVTAFSPRDRVLCRRFMERGGWILYACGFEEIRGSREFLAMNGLRVVNVPLTAFVDTTSLQPTKMAEAWGVEVSSSQAEILGAQYGYPYCVRVNHGAGGLVLIADTDFLLNPNLESMTGYTEENILFWKWLFERLPLRRAVSGQG